MQLAMAAPGYQAASARPSRTRLGSGTGITTPENALLLSPLLQVRSRPGAESCEEVCDEYSAGPSQERAPKHRYESNGAKRGGIDSDAAVAELVHLTAGDDDLSPCTTFSRPTETERRFAPFIRRGSTGGGLQCYAHASAAQGSTASPTPNAAEDVGKQILLCFCQRQMADLRAQKEQPRTIVRYSCSPSAHTFCPDQRSVLVWK